LEGIRAGHRVQGQKYISLALFCSLPFKAACVAVAVGGLVYYRDFVFLLVLIKILA